MVNKVLSVFILLFAFAGFSPGQNISVQTSTDSTDYQVGDYIHYVIKIKQIKI